MNEIENLKSASGNLADALEACEKAAGFVPGHVSLPDWIAGLRERAQKAEADFRQAEESRAVNANLLDDALKRLQKAEAACAEKDAALRECSQVIVKASNMHNMIKCSNFLDEFVFSHKIAKALSSDCGKDYVPRSELDKLHAESAEIRDQLKQCREAFHRHGWSTGQLDRILASTDCGKDYVPRSELDYYKGRVTRLEAEIRERQERDEDAETTWVRALKAELDAEKAKVQKLRDAITRMFAARATGSWQIEADAAEKAKQALEETK